MSEKQTNGLNINMIMDDILKESEEIKKNNVSASEEKEHKEPKYKRLVLLDTLLPGDDDAFAKAFVKKVLGKEPIDSECDAIKKKLKKFSDRESFVYDFANSSEGRKLPIEVVGFTKVYMNDLMSFDGMEFIEKCFLFIMQRRVDENARTIFYDKLTKDVTKEQMIYEFRNTPEGIETNVEIIGLEKAFKTQRTKRLPQIAKETLYSLIHVRRIRLELDTATSQIAALQRKCNELQQLNEDLNKKIDAETKRIDEEIRKIKDCEFTGDFLRKLNYLSSAYPTVWGDESKINISPLAAVHTCLFNTNSGSITVGDYTFAGSNVSILAGSHDKNLTGLLRRDSEVTDGCDITIGKGVWLGSNCTILGPAVIEDDAVIAAGAVVTPGTHVEKGSIYGGVPAKKISEVSEEQKEEAVYKAFERNKGVLFTDGWTEKRKIRFDNKESEGRLITGREAEILVGEGHWVMRYARSSTKSESISFFVKEDQKKFNLAGKEGRIEFDVEKAALEDGKSWCRIRVEYKDTEDCLGVNITGAGE